MTKALPKLALSACNNLQGSSGLRLIMLYYTFFCAGYLSQALITPEAHGTITGAVGREFRYHSGYLSLKFSFGFSACTQNINNCILARLKMKKYKPVRKHFLIKTI
jgi:hypothetical protein